MAQRLPRDVSFNFRLTSEERRILDELADKAHMTPAELIRRWLWDAYENGRTNDDTAR